MSKILQLIVILYTSLFHIFKKKKKIDIPSVSIVTNASVQFIIDIGKNIKDSVQINMKNVKDTHLLFCYCNIYNIINLFLAQRLELVPFLLGGCHILF
jgi:hypothetical protein